MLKRESGRHKFAAIRHLRRAFAETSRGGWTWVHAVSVGEVMIALKLIRETKHHDPQLPVVLSTTTSTGFALASKEKGEHLETIYNLIDFSGQPRVPSG
jgi:3-deoxy-D-manno-octulosonic-acid transferase